MEDITVVNLFIAAGLDTGFNSLPRNLTSYRAATRSDNVRISIHNRGLFSLI
jgi:hypothetical protein